LFGWKVRLLTRRLLAFGTSGFQQFRNSVLAHCAARMTTY
jgi:hypothetical protein